MIPLRQPLRHLPPLARMHPPSLQRHRFIDIIHFPRLLLLVAAQLATLLF